MILLDMGDLVFFFDLCDLLFLGWKIARSLYR